MIATERCESRRQTEGLGGSWRLVVVFNRHWGHCVVRRISGRDTPPLPCGRVSTASTRSSTSALVRPRNRGVERLQLVAGPAWFTRGTLPHGQTGGRAHGRRAVGREEGASRSRVTEPWATFERQRELTR